MTGQQRRVTRWPFWAATSDERIEQAFAMAGLRPGEQLLDLGCGDGRVLLRAAALHGARVVGVELDPELAASARRLLADHDTAGTVIEGDFADVLGDAATTASDVVFAYLSPATMQRIRPHLARLPAGTRVVSAGYAIPGWEAQEVRERCFLYRLPATATPIDPAARGWASPGVLVGIHPDAPSLVAVKLRHHGGPVNVSVTAPALASALELRAGADEAQPGDEIVIDLRFDPRPEGTVLAGTLEAPGFAPFQVFVAVDAGPPGVWGLSAPGCEAVGDAIAQGTLAGVLDEARQSDVGSA